jgi:hypothetical protein
MKLIPLSLVLITILLPALLAQRSGPKRSVKLLFGLMPLIVVIWAFLCMRVYPLYVQLE